MSDRLHRRWWRPSWRGRPWQPRRLRRALGALALLLLGAGLVGVAWVPGGGREVRGHAAVIDGDTLHVAGQRIRLDGLDAPEARQVCERGGADWACGAEATRALRAFLEWRSVRCAGSEVDRYGRLIARCWAGEEEIGAWLVRQGHAVAYRRFSWRYVPQELLARWEGRGIWAGHFDEPEAWRRSNRD
jgi:endonuclease YncB( thermonuclease family)